MASALSMFSMFCHCHRKRSLPRFLVLSLRQRIAPLGSILPLVLALALGLFAPALALREVALALALALGVAALALALLVALAFVLALVSALNHNRSQLSIT